MKSNIKNYFLRRGILFEVGVNKTNRIEWSRALYFCIYFPNKLFLIYIYNNLREMVASFVESDMAINSE